MNRLSFDDVMPFEGREAHVRIVGRGPDVVEVHGTPSSSFDLRHIIYGLAHNHRVRSFDPLGYGRSNERPGDLSLGVQNRVLAALLRHRRLDASMAIGHDFGGTTVLRARRVEPMLSRSYRDAELKPEIFDTDAARAYLRHWKRMAAELIDAWPPTTRVDSLFAAAVEHALHFQTWRLLVRTQGLTDAEAIELMATVVSCAAPGNRAQEG